MLVNHAKGKSELDLHTIKTWIGASPGFKLTFKLCLSTFYTSYCLQFYAKIINVFTKVSSAAFN